MNYEVADNRENECKFKELKELDCFYIGDMQEPYIKVPDHPHASDEDPKQSRTCNAIRIRTLHHVYLVPDYQVYKLEAKLILSTETSPQQENSVGNKEN